jgi:hypothetical protein
MGIGKRASGSGIRGSVRLPSPWRRDPPESNGLALAANETIPPPNRSRQMAPDLLGVALEHIALARIREERDQVVEATRQIAAEGVRDVCRRSCQPQFAGSE